MYYEEDVINGVLCWRGSPDGEWTPYTARELTEALVRSRAVAVAGSLVMFDRFTKRSEP